MCCAVASKETFKTKKAHPTIHAFSSVIPSPHKGGRLGRAKGAFWADAGTANVSKFQSRKPKKRPTPTNDNDFKITETEDIALRNEIRRSMQSVSHRNMRAIMPNLRNMDKLHKGRLTYDKVREVLQQNQISLSEAGFRNLGKKFGEKEEEHHVVRYEKLVSYVTKLWSEAAALPQKKPSTPPAAGFSNSEDRISGNNFSSNHQVMGGNQRIVKMRNRVMFSDSDESRMLMDLAKELSENESANMADLRRVMYNFDRDRNNFLNEGQVYASFQKCGIYISPEVFQQLLMATDRTGAGAYSIETLINYLIRVRPDLQHYLLLGENHFPRRARVPVLPSLSQQPMFSTPWEQPYPSFSPEELPEEDLEDYSEAYGEDLIEEEEQFNPAKWSKDFQVVVEALHNADEDRTGFLPEKEVRHLANTYLLVYNLGVMDRTLNTAIRKAYDRSLNEVNLDHFANILEEEHFKYISNSKT